MKKEEYRFFADPFSFAPAIADSASGKLFDCSKDITIETPDVDTLREFSISRYAVFKFADIDTKAGISSDPKVIFFSEESRK